MNAKNIGLMIAFLVLAHDANAREIYVDNLSGDDRNNGAAPISQSLETGPCRTITKALRLARKGDRVILANTGQPYREAIAMQGGNHSGYPHLSFTIVGNGAVLDGSKPVPGDDWEHVSGSIFRFRPDRLSYQQLFLDDKPAQRQMAAPGRSPKLEPLQWSLLDRFIYFRCEKGKTPEDYQLTYSSKSVGITLYEVRNVEINDLVVQGFQLDGINALDSAFEVTLTSVTSRGNGRSGISVGGSSRVTIGACLIGNNGAAQVRTEGWSHTKIINCDLLDNTAPALRRHGGEVVIENPVDSKDP